MPKYGCWSWRRQHGKERYQAKRHEKAHASAATSGEQEGTVNTGTIAGFECVSVEHIGKRPEMEDFAHIQRISVGGSDALYAGVYDGHSGRYASQFLKERLCEVVESALASQGDDDEKAIASAFERADRDLCELPDVGESGSTASTVVIYPPSVGSDDGGEIVAANTGDSMAAVLSGSTRTAGLTKQHRPFGRVNKVEIDRIKANGGFVLQGRVQGELAVSRAFGDAQMKSLIPSTPEISRHHISPSRDRWLLVASDGVWDVLSPGQAWKLASRFADSGKSLSEIAAMLADEAIHRRNCGDNVALVLIDLAQQSGRSPK